MMNPVSPVDPEHALASLGLVLLLQVARLVDAAYPTHSDKTRVASLLARRAIDLIAVAGWLADRLPTPDYLRPVPQSRDAGPGHPHVRPA